MAGASGGSYLKKKKMAERGCRHKCLAHSLFVSLPFQLDFVLEGLEYLAHTDIFVT